MRSASSSSSTPGSRRGRARARGTERLHAALLEVYPGLTAAESVFQTTLQNGNPVIHPAVTLLNAALIERTGGDFRFYEEGVTESVGRLIEGVDRERLAIAAALGVTILSEPEIGILQGYMVERTTRPATPRRPGSAASARRASSTTAT